MTGESVAGTKPTCYIVCKAQCKKKCRVPCSKIIKNFSNSKALNQVWGPSELTTKCECINSCSRSWPWTAMSPVLEQKIVPHAGAGRERPTGFEQWDLRPTPWQHQWDPARPQERGSERYTDSRHVVPRFNKLSIPKSGSEAAETIKLKGSADRTVGGPGSEHR